MAYLLGRDGSTKRRLELSSGARIEVERDTIEIIGEPSERELARLFVDMTLEQRKGRMQIEFDDIGDRDDCEVMDIPKECVGFVLGNRGATLRTFEERCRAYMIFDNETMRQGKKRLYILGQSSRARGRARGMVQEAVDFRLRKDTEARARRSGSRSRSRGRGRRRSRSRSRGRRRRSRS